LIPVGDARYVGASYTEAIEFAKKNNVEVPMLK